MQKIKNQYQHKKLRSIAAFLLLLSVFLLCLSGSEIVKAIEDEYEYEEEAREFDDLISSYAGEISELQSRREEIGRQRNEIEEDLKSLSDMQHKVNREFEWLLDRSEKEQEVYLAKQEELDGVLHILETLNMNLEVSMKQYEEKRIQCSERIAAMFEMQKKSLLQIYLESNSLEGFLTTLKFMKIVTAADEEALAELKASEERLQRQKEATDKEAGELKAQVDRVKQEINAIERGLFDIQRQYDRLDRDMKSKAAVAANYSRQSRMIMESIRSAERNRTLAEQRAAELRRKRDGVSSSTGPAIYPELTWPLPGEYEITSRFGYRDVPELGLHDFHTGLDTAANVGTPIVAAADGIVIIAGPIQYGGTTVRIAHGNGFDTMYCHMSAVNCNVGDEVLAGDVIGFVGSTGMSTGPHLHFEIQIDGTPVDPELYLY